ncbi:uncharacterized protein [Rutidosis leptorrhynchoides]|uniref:uncharacterized protein n=1 Tax=Rutidosis leptorrhynchoides TaxID=125765 RepID=UPI003A98FF6C
MASNQEFVPLNMLNNELTNPSVRIKVFSVWNGNYWTNPNILASIEMGNKIAATSPKKLITFFHRTFVEGNFLDLTGFGVVPYEERNYRMEANEWKVVLFLQTMIRRAAPFVIQKDGFVPLSYIDVNEWNVDGFTAFMFIEIKWDKGSAKKSITFYFRDLAGTHIKCTLWSNLTDHLYQYVEAHKEDKSLIICLINNCKLSDFKANLTSGVLPLVNKDDLVLSTNETFKAKKFHELPKVIMADVHQIQKVKSFVICGKVDNICDGDGWFGFHCQQCKKKVQLMYCLDQEKPDYFFTTCDKEVFDVTPKYV